MPFHDLTDLFGLWVLMLSLFANPLSLLTLPVAVYLFLYYNYKKSADDCKLDTLTLVRQLSKEPYQEKINENLCISLLKKSKISPNVCTMLPYKTSLFLASYMYFHISGILSDKNHTEQLACYGGSLKVIDFMLRHGADPHQTNQNGDGAIYFAVYGIICRLKCSSRRIPRSTVIQQGVLLIDTLTNFGCNINLKNETGFTPFHWAVISKERWLAIHLLLRGANMAELHDSFTLMP